MVELHVLIMYFLNVFGDSGVRVAAGVITFLIPPLSL